MEVFMSLYFVATEPSQELSEKIREVQKDFAENYEAIKALKNFPHITLIPPFHFDEQKEAEIVGHFKKVNLDQPKFELKLNGFDSFQNPRNPVIFIKPENCEPLKKLYNELKSGMPYHFLDHFNPHLTVAYRDLTFENFEKARKVYSDKEFTGNFEINRIGLYKHFDRKWNLIAERKLN